MKLEIKKHIHKTQNVHNTISVSKPQRGISNYNNTEMYTNQSKKQGQMLCNQTRTWNIKQK